MQHLYCACVVALLCATGKGSLDVASGVPKDEGRSCSCRPFEVSLLQAKNPDIRDVGPKMPCDLACRFRLSDSATDGGCILRLRQGKSRPRCGSCSEGLLTKRLLKVRR